MVKKFCTKIIKLCPDMDEAFLVKKHKDQAKKPGMELNLKYHMVNLKEIGWKSRHSFKGNCNCKCILLHFYFKFFQLQQELCSDIL